MSSGSGSHKTTVKVLTGLQPSQGSETKTLLNIRVWCVVAGGFSTSCVAGWWPPFFAAHWVRAALRALPRGPCIGWLTAKQFASLDQASEKNQRECKQDSHL